MEVLCQGFIRSTISQIAQRFQMKKLLKKVINDEVKVIAKPGKKQINELWIPVEFETQTWYVFLEDKGKLIIQPDSRDYHLEVSYDL